MQSLEVTQRTRGGTRTRTFDALGHTFAVACEDDVAGVLDDAFAALAVNADPDDWYCVARGDASFTVARNGHIQFLSWSSFQSPNRPPVENGSTSQVAPSPC